jgi:hypothetical protein
MLELFKGIYVHSVIVHTITYDFVQFTFEVLMMVTTESTALVS